MVSVPRPRTQSIRSRKVTVTKTLVMERREIAAQKIAALLEDQMTDMGLSEEEKNEKTAELVTFVSDAVSSRLAPRAKQPKQLHSAALQA